MEFLRIPREFHLFSRDVARIAMEICLFQRAGRETREKSKKSREIFRVSREIPRVSRDESTSARAKTSGTCLRGRILCGRACVPGWRRCRTRAHPRTRCGPGSVISGKRKRSRENVSDAACIGDCRQLSMDEAARPSAISADPDARRIAARGGSVEPISLDPRTTRRRGCVRDRRDQDAGCVEVSGNPS